MVEHVDQPDSDPNEDTAAPYIADVEAEVSDEDERVARLLTHTLDVPALAEAVEQQEAADAADTLENLDEEEAAEVLEAMEDRAAAEALAEMADPLAVRVIDDLVEDGKADYGGRLVCLMAPDDAADLLQKLDDTIRERLLGLMPVSEAQLLRRLVGYDEHSAAGLMTTDFLALSESMTVGAATEAIRATEIPDETHHLPVADDDGRLVGVIGLRDLLLNPTETRLSVIQERASRAVRANLDQEAVAREFDRYDFFMLPVVDDNDRLLGVVTVDDVIDIIRQEQTEDVQKTVGAGAGEAVYSGVAEKMRGRFPWLIVSAVMMVPSAWVVLQFEGLIGDLAILAMLMPVVAALAGNAGHQALAVTLRGIVLEEVRAERVWPLIRRETIVGMIQGVALGCLVGLAVAAMATLVENASWRLGIVVAVAMTFSMCAGTLAGSSIPLIMKRLDFDPAQSSAIFLIMVTDAAAFLTFLGLASLSYRWLIG